MQSGFSALDLFSGARGLTLGMKEAGILPIAGVERNPDACATYRRHTPDSEHNHADANTLSFKKYAGSVDIVYGGPPCQPFSSGGLRLANDDSRDGIPAFLNAVAITEPQAVLIENVPGLLTSTVRPYFDSILERLRLLGYRVSWELMHSGDYGVPQKRRRVIIVGLRDRYFRFPRPSWGQEAGIPHPASGDYIGAEPIGVAPNSPVFFAPVVDLRRSPYAGHVFKGGGRPVDLTGPCHTVYASAGGNKTHWIDVENVVPAYHAHLMAGGAPREGVVPGARRMSVEESAIIQTFPADFVFEGSRSSQYTQVGDAVPPLLASVLGRALVAHLEDHTLSDNLYYPAHPGAVPLFDGQANVVNA